MTDHEQLPSHEVAEQLRLAGYPVVRGHVESRRLAAVLNRSQSVRQQLAAGRFEQNEYGYATVTVEDGGRNAKDQINALRVTFHDPLGNMTELGGVTRMGKDEKLGTAYIVGLDGFSEPLVPQDERWDAVVGTIGRAVGVCLAQVEERS